MWLTKLLAAIMAILTGLVPSSCTSSKKMASQQHTPIVTIVTSSESLNKECLGELQLTNRQETCINLGAGKSCTFKPTSLGHASLQLTMSLECKNAHGGVKGLSIVQVVTKSGEPCDVAVGGVTLNLTPILAAE
jgi:hypothetical protein